MTDKLHKDNILELYSSAYSMLENRTPVMFDCGKLCSAACCSNNGLGMLLFPFEEELQSSFNTDFSINDSNIIVDNHKIKLLKCTGSCNRSTRPLACRIFPLFPFVFEDGRISVEFDPRAAGTCPLLLTDIDGIYIGGIFRLMVYKTAALLCSEPLIKSYLIKLTKELEVIKSFRSPL